MSRPDDDDRVQALIHEAEARWSPARQLGARRLRLDFRELHPFPFG